MKTRLLTIALSTLSLFTIGQLPENFKAEQWEKLDAETQELVERISAPACDCVSEYQEETDALLKVIFELGQLKRKGGTVTEEIKARHKAAFEECNPYFECLKNSSPTEEEKGQMTDAIVENIGEPEDEYKLKIFKAQMIGHAMRENCEDGVKKAMNFVFITAHIVGFQKGLDEK